MFHNELPLLIKLRKEFNIYNYPTQTNALEGATLLLSTANDVGRLQSHSDHMRMPTHQRHLQGSVQRL